jgi:hypothetical protein
MSVVIVIDMEDTILGWLWGDGRQEEPRLPCLRVRGLMVHDALIHGLRVCSLPDAQRGKHRMLLKAFVLPQCWLTPAHSSQD